MIARLRDETGVQLKFHDPTALANARLALGDDAFDQAWREGNAMDLEEAMRCALNGRAAGGT